MTCLSSMSYSARSASSTLRKTVKAAIVAFAGDFRRLQCGLQSAIEAAEASQFGVVGRNRIVDLLHRGQDRLLVGGQQSARLQVGDFDLRVESAKIQHRHGDRWSD